MPTDFSDLYGDNGLGFLIGDTSSGSVSDRKVAVNDAYVELASIRGYWRKRTHEYTTASSPAISQGNYQFDLPSSYDTMYRLYYLWAGKPKQIKVLDDDQWLELAALDADDTGNPRIARIQQTAAVKQIEVSPRISANFLSQIGTIYLEYFIEITRLSADADEPIIPENYRHFIKFLAAKKYAIGQGDRNLMQMLTTGGVISEAEKGISMLRRHDLTRTGQSQGLRPRTSYLPKASSFSDDYGGSE